MQPAIRLPRRQLILLVAPPCSLVISGLGKYVTCNCDGMVLRIYDGHGVLRLCLASQERQGCGSAAEDLRATNMQAVR